MNRQGVRLSAAVKAGIRADLARGMSTAQITKKRGISKTPINRVRHEPSVSEPEAAAPEASDPRAIYAREKALSEARKSDQLAPAKAAFAAQLERDREARKGGRPRTNTNLSGRPGKPRLNVTRPAAADALWEALPFYGVPGMRRERQERDARGAR